MSREHIPLRDTRTRDWGNPSQEQVDEFRAIVEQWQADCRHTKVKRIERGNGCLSIISDGHVLNDKLLGPLLEAGFVVGASSDNGGRDEVKLYFKPVETEVVEETVEQRTVRNGEIVETSEVESRERTVVSLGTYSSE